MRDTFESDPGNNGKSFGNPPASRKDNHAYTSYNNPVFIYTLKARIPRPWEALPLPQTFGEHLRLARLKRNLQVKELAKILGFSQEIVSLWERGKAHPTQFWMVRKLKEILPELVSLPTKLLYPYFPDSPQSLAEAVKRERLLLDLSQEEYAKRLGAGIHTIVDRERGRIQSATTRTGKLVCASPVLNGTLAGLPRGNRDVDRRPDVQKVQGKGA